MQFAIYMLEHPKHSLFVEISCMLLRRVSEGDIGCARPFLTLCRKTNDNKVIRRVMEGIIAGDNVFDGTPPGDAGFFPRAVSKHEELKADGLV